MAAARRRWLIRNPQEPSFWSLLSQKLEVWLGMASGRGVLCGAPPAPWSCVHVGRREHKGLELDAQRGEVKRGGLLHSSESPKPCRCPPGPRAQASDLTSPTPTLQPHQTLLSHSLEMPGTLYLSISARLSLP